MLPVTFLDLRKAFDRVWHDGLLYQLAQAGIGGRAWCWIEQFLTGREFRVVDQAAASNWHTTPHGVPQGCVLSPTLFLVFINPVASIIASQGGTKLPLSPLMYADDVAFSFDPSDCSPAQSPERIREAMLAALARLDSWGRRFRMEFNHSKCVTVVFSRHHASTADKAAAAQRLAQLHFPPLRKGEAVRALAAAEHTKYLGLTMDRRLEWAPQLAAVMKGALETARKIARVVRPASPPGPVVIRRLVTGMLLPQLTYALEHWHPQLSARTRMRAALIRPLAKALALPYTSNHASLLAEFNIPSIATYQQRVRVRSMQRALRLPAAHPTHALLLAQRHDVSKKTEALHLRPQLRLALEAEAALLFAHSAIQFAPLASLYRSTVPTRDNPKDRALTRLLGEKNELARDGIALRAPQGGYTLARAAQIVSLDEWRRLNRTTASLMQCVVLPEVPLYLTADHPLARRIRARLRHDRTLTQAHRHMCFARDATDPRHADSPNCLHADCASMNVRETGQHATIDCPAVAPRLARLRADLLTRLGRAPNDDEIWLLILGHCPQGVSPTEHAELLAVTACYLIDVNEGRRPRNAKLMPLAYPLRVPAALQ